MNKAQASSSSDSTQLVDRIIYLAQLVSKPQAIDQDLDTVRAITSFAVVGKQPSAEDITKLNQTQSRIKRYLLEQEPLRKFTAQSLEQNLYEHFQGHTTMRRLRYAALLTAGVTLGVPLIVFGFLPYSDFGPKLTTVMPLGFAIMHWAAAALFLSALPNFQADLRKVYQLISGGIVVLGIAHLQLVAITLTNLSDPTWSAYFHSWWSQVGGLYLPFCLSFVLMYIGCRQFAKLLNLKSRLIQTKFVASLVAVISIGLILTPHAPALYDAPEPLFDTSVVILGLMCLAISLSLGIVRQLRRQLSVRYDASMKWLSFALFAALGGSLLSLVAYLIGSSQLSGSTQLLLILAGLLFLKSGYEFNRISRY